MNYLYYVMTFIFSFVSGIIVCWGIGRRKTKNAKIDLLQATIDQFGCHLNAFKKTTLEATIRLSQQLKLLHESDMCLTEMVKLDHNSILSLYKILEIMNSPGDRFNPEAVRGIIEKWKSENIDNYKQQQQQQQQYANTTNNADFSESSKRNEDSSAGTKNYSGFRG